VAKTWLSPRLKGLHICHYNDNTLDARARREKQTHTHGNASQNPFAGRLDSKAGLVELVDRHLRIAQRAYQYYEEQGREDGHALDHWLKAEREVRSTAPQKTI
jgi:hypothetical protein